jgi:hypothetical protein
MSSILNALGMLIARQPKAIQYPGARTPGYNPGLPMPYPTQGGWDERPPDPNTPSVRIPNDPGGQPVGQPGAPVSQSANPAQGQGFLRRLYEGMVTNPMGPAVTLAMANSLTAPKQPGQTDTGHLVQSIGAGYNSMAALAQFRAAQEAARRAEAREDRKIGQTDTRIKTEQETAAATKAHQERSDVTSAQEAATRKAQGEAAATRDTEQHQQHMAALQKQAEQAERQFKAETARWNQQAIRDQNRDDLLRSGQIDQREHQIRADKSDSIRANAAMLGAQASAKRAEALGALDKLTVKQAQEVRDGAQRDFANWLSTPDGMTADGDTAKAKMDDLYQRRLQALNAATGVNTGPRGPQGPQGPKADPLGIR